MTLLIACGTFIRGDRKTVADYIRSCDIFPNIEMICRATGLPEPAVLRAIGFLSRQERVCVGRRGLSSDLLSEGLCSKKDILISLLLDEYENAPDAANFMRAQRFYNQEGDICYRFTEAGVARVFELREKRLL